MFLFRAWTNFILLLSVLYIACTGPGAGKSNLPMQVALAYGAGAFDRIDKLKYTFHVKSKDKTFSRSWLWDVGRNQVTLEQQGAAPFSYARSKMPDTAGENTRKIDGQFINDQYWLLFPLHLSWDPVASVTVVKNRSLPIGSGTAACITVVFPPAVGYTPGDAFDLYVDKNYHIVQWVYRRGNGPEAVRTNRWEDNRRAGPLLLSLDRPGADSTFRVWFTDVGVQLKGNNAWLSPK